MSDHDDISDLERRAREAQDEADFAWGELNDARERLTPPLTDQERADLRVRARKSLDSMAAHRRWTAELVEGFIDDLVPSDHLALVAHDTAGDPDLAGWYLLIPHVDRETYYDLAALDDGNVASSWLAEHLNAHSVPVPEDPR